MRSPRPKVNMLQQLGLECACCGQIYHPDKALEDGFEASVFGAEQYVVCPICGMNVPDDLRGENYKTRWKRATIRMLLTPNVHLLVALSLLMEGRSTPVADKFFGLSLTNCTPSIPIKAYSSCSVPEIRSWNLCVGT